MKLFLTIVVIFLFFTLKLWSQQRNLNFEHINVQNGVSFSSVRSIAQDQNGLMWFGAVDGLSCYDGFSFKMFKYKEGKQNVLTDNLIYKIFIDSKNIIWIGTNNGGLNKYTPGLDLFEIYPSYYNHLDSTPINYVNAILEDKQGFIWVGSYDGLAKFDPLKGLFVAVFDENNLKPKTNDLAIVDMCKDDKGIFWLATRNEGLIRFDPETNIFTKIECSGIETSWDKNKNNCVTIDKNQNLWLGTTNGLYQYNLKTKHIDYFEHNETNDKSISSNEVFAIYEDSMGELWLTGRDGLDLFDVNTKIFFHYRSDINIQSSISDNVNMCIYEDRSNQLWIGGESKGINKFNIYAKQFEHLLHKKNDINTISSNRIRRIYEDDQQKIWIGLYETGLDIVDKKKGVYSHYTHNRNDPNSLADNRVCAILKDKNKNIWIGTEEGGLEKAVLKNGKYQFIHHKHDPKNPKSLSNNVVTDIYEDTWGRLWIGTKQGLDLFDPLKNEFINISKKTDGSSFLIHKSVQSNCIKQDRFGNLWVGTWGGLTQIKLSLDTHLPIMSYHFRKDRRNRYSLSDNRVIAIHFDKKNNLWIGTFGGGLNKLSFDKKGKGALIKHYTEANGLSNNEVFACLEDKNECLWLSTNKGLSKFDLKSEKINTYDISDGLQSNRFYWGAAFQSKDGRLLFGGINGISSFFPDSIKPVKLLPQLMVLNFKIFNQDIEIGPKSILKKQINELDLIYLNYTDKVFSFELGVLHYASPEKNKYAYKLDGFDKNWIYTDSKNRVATYTNLDPGKYTFRFKGAIADGAWTEMKRPIKIIITPPFWSSWWFRVLVVLILFSFILGVNEYKTRRLRLQKKILEQRVIERTSELRGANNLLKERQDEIMQQSEEIFQQSDELVMQRDTLFEQNRYIIAQNSMITEKNEQIDASIRYALTIQQALLPSNSQMKEWFDCFVYFHPKDIISGDFYWFSEIQTGNESRSCMLAVADCTGHGVPGAFMSMLGTNLLNEITYKNREAKPAEVLEDLDAGIKRTLRQEHTENQDGLEIILCKIVFFKTGEVELCFSGSKLNLFHYHASQDSIEIYKSDKRVIGGLKHKQDTLIHFTNKTIKINQKDCIYLCSDGIIDQHNSLHKRFGTRSLINLVQKIAKETSSEQLNLITTKMDIWRQSEAQTDDLTVLGIVF